MESWPKSSHHFGNDRSVILYDHLEQPIIYGDQRRSLLPEKDINGNSRKPEMLPKLVLDKTLIRVSDILREVTEESK